MRYHVVLLGLVACLHPDTPPPRPIVPVPPPAAPAPEPAPALRDKAVLIDVVPAAAHVAPIVPPPPLPEAWLRGSTHVHARPSGDSTTPIHAVIDWYENRGYDFIVLTDHNRVSEVDPATDTLGQLAVRAPERGLIVLAGIELTTNPSDCEPQVDPKRRCRIHVNLLGCTARPGGKLEWADRKARLRVDKYQAAIAAQKVLGGIAQINHPQWFWGASPELLVELARRGVSLVEIANAQFDKWNRGDAEHPSMEMLWDAALERGSTVWGVASDDAHHYNGGGEYPAGGAWVVVRARRDPGAIVEALAGGRFYSSNGVVLERAGADRGALVVEVAAGQPGTYAIDFIENGKIVATVKERSARHPVPATGYVRAVVTRDDGKKAWIQPARRP